MRPLPFVLAVLALLTGGCSNRTNATPDTLLPTAVTEQVANDADDPAVWINTANPEASLIVGTNKVAAPDGGLYVFDVQGRVRQVIKPLDRPNNVDIEYRFSTGEGPIDIAVVTERLQNRLRVYRIDEQGLAPVDAGGIPVCEGEAGEAAMPMGIALYRRARDGVVFAIVAPKTGGTSAYLWQYRLETDPEGVVRGHFVRRFGNYSGSGEIEAVVVDDEQGYVYYSDEEYGLRKWSADPDSPDADKELAVFGRDGFKRQREGLAILTQPGGKGFIVASDQIEGAAELRIYRREGSVGNPHDHDPVVAVIPTSSDSTDGLDLVTTNLGPRFPQGMLLMMSSKDRAFNVYDLRSLLERLPGAR